MNMWNGWHEKIYTWEFKYYLDFAKTQREEDAV